MKKYYVGVSNVGTYLIFDCATAFPLSGQRYGYLKQERAQQVADDLNSGKETPESMYKLWTAGEK